MRRLVSLTAATGLFLLSPPATDGAPHRTALTHTRDRGSVATSAAQPQFIDFQPAFAFRDVDLRAYMLWGCFEGLFLPNILPVGRTAPYDALDSPGIRMYKYSEPAFFDHDDFGDLSRPGAVVGDYDNDGFVDFVLGDQAHATRIFRSNGSTGVVATGIAFPEMFGVTDLVGDWGDCDNDGDADLVMAANGNTRLYRNDDGGVFTLLTTPFVGVSSGCLRWGDCDSDGDLDLLVTGTAGVNTYVAKVYRNDGVAGWTDFLFPIYGGGTGSGAWGDADNDGDLDLVLNGFGADGISTLRVWENVGGALVGLRWEGPQFVEGGVALGDCNNDGMLDIAVSGLSNSVPTTTVFRNTGDFDFEDTGVAFRGGYQCYPTWLDYDLDGKLDLLIGGSDFGGPHATLYRNISDGSANAFPAQPQGLRTSRLGDNVTFGWDPSTDAETPSSGLYYRLRVGTSAGGNEIASALIRYGAMGSVSHAMMMLQTTSLSQRTLWTLQLPPGPTYYWSVQAVDPGNRVSQWNGLSETASNTVSAPPAELGASLRLTGRTPARGVARMALTLPAESRVRVTVYDTMGRSVGVCADGVLSAGTHELTWPHHEGHSVTPGIYFGIADVNGRRLRQRLVLIE